MGWRTQENPLFVPPSPPSCLFFTVPIIWMGTHGCVQQWQVPETHPDHPNPSSHIHSHSDNSWCAGSFPASSFIRSGICVSLFLLVKWGGIAIRPCQVYTAWWRDLKQGHGPTNTIKYFLEENVFFIFFSKVGSPVCFLTLKNDSRYTWNN